MGKPLGARIVNFKIHDSRHGLILCSFYSSSLIPQIVVCNPTTQKYKVFHQRALNLYGRIPNSAFYLSFDPSISPIYKLILIRYARPHYDFAICASNRSMWKTISLEFQQLWGRGFIDGVLSSDGVIHMITEKWYLVQFDVETEKLSAARMTQEPKMPRSRMIGYFGEGAGGNLILVVSNKSGLDFMVYEMNRLEGRHWVLKHHIDLTHDLHEMPQPIRRCNIAVMWVCLDGEDEERDSSLVLGVSEKVISYNQNSKEMKSIRDLPGLESFDWETSYRYVHPFIGSLCAV